MRAHFTNMMPISFHQSANRAQTNFDDQISNISTMLNKNYTIKSKSRQNLNIDLDENEIDNINARNSQINKSVDSSMTTMMTCKKKSGNKSNKPVQMVYTMTNESHNQRAAYHQTAASTKKNFYWKEKETHQHHICHKCPEDQMTTCQTGNLNTNQQITPQ
jgi:hypothetical protein